MRRAADYPAREGAVAGFVAVVLAVVLDFAAVLVSEPAPVSALEQWSRDGSSTAARWVAAELAVAAPPVAAGR